MTTDLPPLPAAPPGRYRHYKGGEYEVLGVTRHTETREVLVLYRTLYDDSGLWVRPYEMFFGQVEINGRSQARFARMDDRVAPAERAAAPVTITTHDDLPVEETRLVDEGLGTANDRSLGYEVSHEHAVYPHGIVKYLMVREA